MAPLASEKKPSSIPPPIAVVLERKGGSREESY